MEGKGEIDLENKEEEDLDLDDEELDENPPAEEDFTREAPDDRLNRTPEHNTFGDEDDPSAGGWERESLLQTPGAKLGRTEFRDIREPREVDY